MIRIHKVIWGKAQTHWAITRDHPPLAVIHENMTGAIAAWRDYRRANWRLQAAAPTKAGGRGG